jgi:hypothetical protein
MSFTAREERILITVIVLQKNNLDATTFPRIATAHAEVE